MGGLGESTAGNTSLYSNRARSGPYAIDRVFPNVLKEERYNKPLSCMSGNGVNGDDPIDSRGCERESEEGEPDRRKSDAVGMRGGNSSPNKATESILQKLLVGESIRRITSFSLVPMQPAYQLFRTTARRGSSRAPILKKGAYRHQWESTDPNWFFAEWDFQ